MSDNQGAAFISRDTVFRGRIKGARIVTIDGYVEGSVTAARVVVNEGGQLFGQVSAGDVDVHGTLQGDVLSRGLLSIGETGVLSGDVQYGAIQIEPGGDLTATMKNIPPRLTGDFEISVNRGRSAQLTPEDVQAVDPDNTADELTFSVLNVTHGHLAYRAEPNTPITTFTQADLDAGKIQFQHDGSAGDGAEIDVSVKDAAGASSASPAKVRVHVADFAAMRAAAE